MFSNCSFKKIKQLVERSKVLVVKKGAVLFSYGEKPTGIYYIISGELAIILPSRLLLTSGVEDGIGGPASFHELRKIVKRSKGRGSGI